MDQIAVIGIYPTYQSVESAVSILKSSGIRDKDVSLLLPENLGAGEDPVLGSSVNVAAAQADNQNAGLTWLSGLDVLALPGVGPMLIAGPIGGALTSANGAASIAGALSDFGVADSDARQYERYLQDGGILLSIHGDDVSAANSRLLEQTGARHIAIVRTADEPVGALEERS